MKERLPPPPPPAFRWHSSFFAMLLTFCSGEFLKISFGRLCRPVRGSNSTCKQPYAKSDPSECLSVGCLINVCTHFGNAEREAKRQEGTQNDGGLPGPPPPPVPCPAQCAQINHQETETTEGSRGIWSSFSCCPQRSPPPRFPLAVRDFTSK